MRKRLIISILLFFMGTLSLLATGQPLDHTLQLVVPATGSLITGTELDTMAPEIGPIGEDEYNALLTTRRFEE